MPISQAVPGTRNVEVTEISPWLILLIATACGLIVANLYYAQPLVGPISVALGMPPRIAGLIVTMTQLGYGLGLLFVVPLGDLIENRKLILSSMVLGVAALLCAGATDKAAVFLCAALAIGLGSVAVQILVPYAAHMAPERSRGKVIGNVMSGLMLGIMLARPVASFTAQFYSWHTIFFLSAALMVILAAVLAIILPKRQPTVRVHYLDLLRSMLKLAVHTRVLRRRALYHAFLFASFSVFWTTVPLLLAQQYHLSQAGIAWFALAGVAGAIASPLAGRIADVGLTRPATVVAMLLVSGAFLLTHLAQAGSALGLAVLVAAAILLDFGVAANLTLGQRAIFVLGAEIRSRLNGIFMATFFAGGALGSALGAWAYAYNGWWLASCIGTVLPLIALAYLATE